MFGEYLVSITEGKRMFLGEDVNQTVKMTDSELVDKFCNNVSRVLPSPQIDEATEQVLKLDKLENIDTLIKLGIFICIAFCCLLSPFFVDQE